MAKVEGLFAADEVGPLKLKGLERPVLAFALGALRVS